MDPWSEDAAIEDAVWALARAKRAQTKPPRRIRLPKVPKPPPRDELARTLPTFRALAEFVGEVRAGLGIPQARLAARAGVSRQWIVALESGRPTIEAGKLFRTLEALGFEITLTPYDPPPPWMLRAVAETEAKRERTAQEARRRRAGRRAQARLARLAGHVTGERLDLG